MMLPLSIISSLLIWCWSFLWFCGCREFLRNKSASLSQKPDNQFKPNSIVQIYWQLPAALCNLWCFPCSRFVPKTILFFIVRASILDPFIEIRIFYANGRQVMDLKFLGSIICLFFSNMYLIPKIKFLGKFFESLIAVCNSWAKVAWVSVYAFH